MEYDLESTDSFCCCDVGGGGGGIIGVYGTSQAPAVTVLKA
jgi:hypothetical protein